MLPKLHFGALVSVPMLNQLLLSLILSSISSSTGLSSFQQDSHLARKKYFCHVLIDSDAAVAEAVEKNWAGHQGHLGQQVQKHDSERSGKI